MASMKGLKAASTRALTKYLNELGAQAHTIDDGGDPITREQALAELLWKLALGWTEYTKDEEGNRKEVKHPPVAWAIQYIYDRKEGRTAPTVMEDETRVRAADKVRDLAKNRVNQLASAAAGPAPDRPTAARKGPPKHKPKPKQ